VRDVLAFYKHSSTKNASSVVSALIQINRIPYLLTGDRSRPGDFGGADGQDYRRNAVQIVLDGNFISY
jgi:hypothetical protein